MIGNTPAWPMRYWSHEFRISRLTLKKNRALRGFFRGNLSCFVLTNLGFSLVTEINDAHRPKKKHENGMSSPSRPQPQDSHNSAARKRRRARAFPTAKDNPTSHGRRGVGKGKLHALPNRLRLVWKVRCCGVCLFFADLPFLVNSHIVHSRARCPACLPTGALLHLCFSSNLSTTTQGAIAKLQGTSSEWCNLFLCQCGKVKLR